jgi:hypothetical protein
MEIEEKDLWKPENRENIERAILGNLRGMSRECLEGKRPRAQYMHFWRDIKKKIATYLKVYTTTGQDGTYDIIFRVWEYLKGIKPIKENQAEISKNVLKILEDENNR